MPKVKINSAKKNELILKYDDKELVFNNVGECNRFLSSFFNRYPNKIARLYRKEYQELTAKELNYVLDPVKWGIVEGVVSDEVAQSNKVAINNAILEAKTLGFETFEIGRLDAYFDVRAWNYNDATDNSIILQSDMHFKMSDNTYLRVQPHNRVSGALLSAHHKQNVTISGGNLIGDRYTHDYADDIPENDDITHEFGYGIYLRGVINAVVDGVNSSEHTGDGIILQSTKHRNDDGSEKEGETYNKNHVIKNCTFNKNRRNNISITDVEKFVIENCTISNAGDGGDWSSEEGYNSKGVLPRYNIDLEAINYLDNTGNLRYTEIVRDGDIRNNTFSGAHNGDIDLYKCWDVRIYGNTFDASIANVASYDIVIRDNTFTNVLDRSERKFAIQISERLRSDGTDFCQNYYIYRNTITGYENGIKMGATNNHVHSNKILECDDGIVLLNGNGNHFYNNEITSSVGSSQGYYNFAGGVEVRNINISNETINVDRYGLLFIKLNRNAVQNEMTFNNCSFTGLEGIELRNTHYITFNNCTYSSYEEKDGTSNIIFN